MFNKAINQYINKVYNVYDINQQTTDDLRVLKSTAFLTPEKYELATGNSAVANIGKSNVATGTATTTYDDGSIKTVTTTKESDGTYKVVTQLKKSKDDLNPTTTTEYIKGNAGGQASSYLSKAHSSIQSLHGATYQVELPMDYLHMLNCVCIYYVTSPKYCYDAGSYIQIPATRLTADSWSQIITDVYNMPSPMKPYYYIHNIAGTGDFNDIYKVTNNGTWDADGNVTEDANSKSNFDRTFKLNDNINASVVEKPIASRIGNASKVRCEIRYGKDDSVFQLVEVLVDYVKVPQHIRLTQEQLDLTMDTSQIMEFPDYVNQEIINELVHLVMTRTSDPILPNHVLITLSIARPTGQLQQSQAQA